MANTYTVERIATLEASPERVYQEIIDFHRWTVWSPWEDLDPDLQRTYSGADSGVGAVYSWSGNRKAGQGRMEITEAVEPSGLTIALDFLKPFKSSSTTSFALSAEGETTRVTWTMTGPLTTLLRVIGIFKSMDKMIGPDLEEGLERLKAVAEAPSTS